MEILGERLKKLRQEKQITQEESGKICGVTKYTISLYESGKSTPNDQIKGMLADFFNVSIDYLLGRSDIKNPKIYNKIHNELTEKDEKDIAKELEKMLKQLGTQGTLIFDGEPLDDKSKETLRLSLENSIKITKITNKR